MLEDRAAMQTDLNRREERAAETCRNSARTNTKSSPSTGKVLVNWCKFVRGPPRGSEGWSICPTVRG